MQSLRFLTACALALVISSTLAEPLPLQQALPGGSQYGLYVQRLDAPHDIALSHNADLLLPPASTLKLLTALAAKLVLPADFRFTTEVRQQGKDLVIHFGGDPTLNRDQLKHLLQQAKTTLAGTRPQHIWIDGSAFEGHIRAGGWPWDNLTACYSAPVSAISIDDNCVQAAAYSDRQPGEPLRVNVPAHQPIKVEVSARIVTPAQQRERRCNLDLTGNDQNEYQLTGCWPVSKNPLPLKLAVQNPARFAQAVVSDLAKQQGLAISGEVRIGSPPSAPARPLAQQHSAPLDTLLRHMLHRSDNQLADALLKAIGAVHFQLPGSYRTGLSALRQLLETRAGIALDNAIIEDGSGLSRSNRLSARQLGQVLDYIFRNDAQLGLLDLMPVAGESGTLLHRRSLNSPPLKGQYRGKTGTLFGTRNLAGILTTAKGQRLAVVQIVTNYFPSPGHQGLPPYLQFEQRLYNSLFGSY